jgi:hypothetical protein
MNMTERQHEPFYLLHHNVRQAARALRQRLAQSGGAPADYVGFIVDVSAPRGRDLAVSQLGEDKVGELLAAQRRRLIPTLTLVVPRSDILEGVAAATPLGETPPPGGAWVVAIGSGENAYAVVDLGDSTRAADGAEPPAARGL